MSIVLIVILIISILSACSREPRAQLTRDDWAPEVREALNKLIAEYADTGAYAVFDFDNTSAIFDVQEQLIIYQLETMAFEIKPDELDGILLTGLSDTDADLTELGLIKGSYEDLVSDICLAYEKLWDEYGGFTAKGLSESEQKRIQSDIYWQEFAAKMRIMYDLVYANESAAVAYPWILYWFTGMTEDEVYELSLASHLCYSAKKTERITWISPSEIAGRAGVVKCTWTSGISVTDNIKELWRALDESGIDVWVCSASCTGAIRAAIDAFGLHEYCTGMLGMTNKLDEDGRLLSSYDYDTGFGYICCENRAWTMMGSPTHAQTQSEGKVTAIENAIMPLYGGKGPIAGFMDSTGDFNFCTEFSDLKLVVCFNRANRSVTDGGGLIAELAEYQKNELGYDLKKANENGDTLYVLQGRDENGMRSFRKSDKTLIVGETEEKLYKNDDNFAQYEYMKSEGLSTADILNTFAIKTSVENSPLGFGYGFLKEYSGYHSK